MPRPAWQRDAWLEAGRRPLAREDPEAFSVSSEVDGWRGAWLARSGEHVMLKLRVLSSSPTLGVEHIKERRKRKKKKKGKEGRRKEIVQTELNKNKFGFCE